MQCITDVQPNGISGAPGGHIDKKHEIVSGQEKCPKSEMKALAIREIVNAGKTPAGFCIRAICLRCCSGFDGIAGMMMSQDGDDGAVFLLTVHKSVCSHIFFSFFFFLQIYNCNQGVLKMTESDSRMKQLKLFSIPFSKHK